MGMKWREFFNSGFFAEYSDSHSYGASSPKEWLRAVAQLGVIAGALFGVAAGIVLLLMLGESIW